MTKKKIHRRIRIGKQFIFLSTVLVLAFVAIGILYDVSTFPSAKHTFDITPRPTLAPRITISYPTPTPPEGFVEVKNFKARQYDPKSMLIDYSEKVKYPQELLDSNESDLTPLSCTRTYLNTIGNWGSFVTYQDQDGGTKKYFLIDPQLLRYIDYLEKKYSSKRLMMINACSTKDDKTFIFYGMSLGGGGDYWGKPYIGIDKGKGIDETIDGIPLGGCSVLQLLKNEFLYIKCSMHEGGGGIDAIYQVNLSNKSVNQLLYCLIEGTKTTCK